MKKERIGFAFCGSFCTHKKVLEQYLLLTQEYETVIPIVSCLLYTSRYLLLTAAYRSLSRPSSAPDAKAFPLRSS